MVPNANDSNELPLPCKPIAGSVSNQSLAPLAGRTPRRRHRHLPDCCHEWHRLWDVYERQLLLTNCPGWVCDPRSVRPLMEACVHVRLYGSETQE